jgi:hypothetical protein
MGIKKAGLHCSPNVSGCFLWKPLFPADGRKQQGVVIYLIRYQDINSFLILGFMV